MKVTFKLFATLRDYLPPEARANSCVVEVDRGTTIQELLDRFEIPAQIELIILLNGKHAAATHELVDGDVLAAFPPIAGG